MKQGKKFMIPALIIVSALTLGACGGTTPTNTPVLPTATVTVAVEATVGMMESPEATESPEVMETAEATESPEAMETAGMTTTPAMMETPMMAETPGSTATAGTSSGDLTGPVADLLGKTTGAMNSVTTYHMSITSEAAGVSSKIEADFERPDRMRMQTDAGGTQIETIVIGKEAYMKVPGVEGYMSTPMASSIPTGDTATILPYASDAQVVGDETINGVDTTHIKFAYDQDKAAADMGTTSAGVTLGRADVDMWIDKSTSFIIRYKTVTTSGAAAGTTTIDYSKFNEPISPPIEKPSNITTMPGMEPAATPAP